LRVIFYSNSLICTSLKFRKVKEASEMTTSMFHSTASTHA